MFSYYVHNQNKNNRNDAEYQTKEFYLRERERERNRATTNLNVKITIYANANTMHDIITALISQTMNQIAIKLLHDSLACLIIFKMLNCTILQVVGISVGPPMQLHADKLISKCERFLKKTKNLTGLQLWRESERERESCFSTGRLL